MAQLNPLSNALSRSEQCGRAKITVARYECTVALMVDGCSKQSGRIGIVYSITESVATNLIAGGELASVSKSRMLTNSAQFTIPKFSQRAIQDSSETYIDPVGIYRKFALRLISL